jgi:hypothetical protein
METPYASAMTGNARLMLLMAIAVEMLTRPVTPKILHLYSGSRMLMRIPLPYIY